VVGGVEMSVGTNRNELGRLDGDDRPVKTVSPGGRAEDGKRADDCYSMAASRRARQSSNRFLAQVLTSAHKAGSISSGHVRISGRFGRGRAGSARRPITAHADHRRPLPTCGADLAET
jgi:hypothetical protein